jgi:hypothetical protein
MITRLVSSRCLEARAAYSVVTSVTFVKGQFLDNPGDGFKSGRYVHLVARQLTVRVPVAQPPPPLRWYSIQYTYPVTEALSWVWEMVSPPTEV